ncbi:AlbA family DNA-binding domain-containing protein [Collinsella intestinalis]|uniref:AlbA family DNA-binding domain-containing protein n=1 Tax=Collinsella intestinalis TaxID=147207 RepID=UPI00195CDD38|nr:ATP-binding protein [Collinsella intestinalis]MBM6907978.1 ATP-binding protein [Collinsella intestinalis]
MAIPVNLDDLINLRTVESTRVEFKTGFNPNPIIHTICAFANDIDNIGGGYIVIGVEEKNGSPVFPLKGVEQPEIDGILKRLVGFCHQIEPLYNPVVEPVEHQGVHLIVIWVPGGFGRPYKAPRDVLAKGPSDKRYTFVNSAAPSWLRRRRSVSCSTHRAIFRLTIAPTLLRRCPT